MPYRRTALPLASWVLAVIAVLGSCSDNPGTGRSSAAAPPTLEVSTSSSSTSFAVTTVVAPTTVTTRPTGTSVPATSESYAEALYAAWTKGDRAAAEKVAQPQAVTDLFARAWQANDGWSFAECSGAAGSIICTWRRPSGQQLLVRVQTGGRSVAVSEVRFQP